jgi:hypothetical protein
MLQTLELHFFDDNLGDVPRDIFLDAPQLLELDSVHPPGVLKFPFPQIKEYTTSGLKTRECVEILRMVPNVTFCRFDNMRSSRLLNHPPVVSYIHFLTIGTCCDLGTFFSLLTLPALSQFSLGFPRRRPWPQAEFMSLMSRSSCQLQRLELCCICITSEDLLCCLKAMPLLRELEVDGMGCGFRRGFRSVIGCGADHRQGDALLANDAVLRELTYHSGLSSQLPLVPLLRSIHLSGTHTFSDGSLLDLVESRWCGTLPEGMVRLDSVRVELSRNFAPQTDARAKVWKGQGLDIVLYTCAA